jgi:hypothetical protein
MKNSMKDVINLNPTSFGFASLKRKSEGGSRGNRERDTEHLADYLRLLNLYLTVTAI